MASKIERHPNVVSGRFEFDRTVTREHLLTLIREWGDKDTKNHFQELKLHTYAEGHVVDFMYVLKADVRTLKKFSENIKKDLYGRFGREHVLIEMSCPTWIAGWEGGEPKEVRNLIL